MFCDFSAPYLFFFSSDAPALLYYSHVPTALFAIVFGIFVYLQNKKELPNKLLLVLTVLFALLNILNLLAWVNIDSRVVTSAWLLSQVVYLTIPILSLYLYQVFVHKRDIKFFTKILGGLVIVVFSGAVALGLTMSSFDLVNCELVETSFLQIYQTTIFSAVFLALLVSFIKMLRENSLSENERKGAVIFTAGLFLFLFMLIFTWQIASVMDNFELEQYGLFGMVIFLGFLGYLIVRFKAFDIKMIGAQALVFSLVVITGSQFFYAKNTTDIVLDLASFALVAVAGYFLIRSVKKEVERKEELEKLSRSLAVANDRLEELDKQKSEFISIASHQLRTPLTAIRGYISLALEGSYGKMDNPEITDLFHKIYTIDLRLSQLVEDLLNVSKIEAGKVQYKWDETSLEPVVRELYDMFIALAKKKGLSIAYEEPKTPLPIMTLDVNKIKEIVSNLIDNAIKYTEKGGVTISIESDTTVARVVIADTGIGISKEDAERLFGKFIRTETTKKMDTGGSGLGLFVGKTFVEAHGGRVYAESDGVGKGSRFIVELPFINPNKNL
ncbi:MAG: HAMP domain-containing histidine kinase [Candidatus Moranbacteria bacterium]|nr:HAMP domain-containing histidine kinase [Candidatus Moranbacteria bacterium]